MLMKKNFKGNELKAVGDVLKARNIAVKANKKFNLKNDLHFKKIREQPLPRKPLPTRRN